jgi:uncharacterized protein with NAD-binding domain and iron-sulfur cluster
MVQPKVAIFGGGVGGLSAAHELSERAFDVTVYEARAIPGGKARSTEVPVLSEPSRQPLPGEHGFRCFPGFYRHLPDTMARIPSAGSAGCVAKQLLPVRRILIARNGSREVVLPADFPVSLEDWRVAVRAVVGSGLEVPPLEIAWFVERLLVLLTSCTARRFAELEHESWWSFSGAGTRSPAYGKYLADGLSRTLVAARAREMSARTGGYILLQLLLDVLDPRRPADRVLSGPTNEVWIDPWLAYLRGRGVNYRRNATVTAIHVNGQLVTGITVRTAKGIEHITADCYVVALPCEQMAPLVTPEMEAADPSLAGIRRLTTRWMNGIQFYLDIDVPLEHGHAVFIDSRWALTAISQRQFWEHGATDIRARGDGRVGGILSVVVSDWETPGLLLQRAAKCCTAAQIEDEVWHQLKLGLNDRLDYELRDDNKLGCFLDDSVVPPNPAGLSVNLEPLLINTVGSWDLRPEARSKIHNLFLSADYVRTNTDLATMEGANEAARRAVNGILDFTGSREPPCRVWPLEGLALFAPARALDRVRFALGLAHVGRRAE